MLEIRQVSKVFTIGGLKNIALNGISVNFRQSEFVAILGPSGSGKTTLLNIIGGLDQYTSGELTINEVPTKRFRDKDWDSYRNHRVGFVFQSYNLIPHQTVLNNVRLALTLSGISKAESIRRAKKALADVGLSEHINKKPAQLSGGQMQRVAIARALVNNPEIVLADEPTGALDSETSIQIMELLKQVAKNKLVVMVTHNPELAAQYATRIVKIKDGKVLADSHPYNGKIKTNLDANEAKRKTKKTKMSFFTALSLSLTNLLTKKARTILVAMAGSIGIIGIALISAVSTGFQNYIDHIENDTLTSYPLALSREAVDVTGVLLGATTSSGEAQDGVIKEKQIITSMLGNVSENDLKSFRRYLDHHPDERDRDIRLIENRYNVDPLIYTRDATGNIAKLNPSSLFSTMVGDSSILSSYSGMTSVYRQYELENMKSDTHVIAGRYPEHYNEMVLYLSDAGQMSDLLAYSLGLHDTQELSTLVTKIMSGESVNVNTPPLTLSYEDILSLDLRLIYNTDLYQYNNKYEIYEDMSSDTSYLTNVYNQKAERLNIVGIVVADDSTFSSGSGVLYLPELVTHIIEHTGESEAVKAQLARPSIDVFSNKTFGDETQDFNFEFSDLVSVDRVALSQAFGMNIDQNAIANETQNYIASISNDISANPTPIKEALITRFKSLSESMCEWLAQRPSDSLTNVGMNNGATFQESEINSLVTDYLSSQDFSDLWQQYYLPTEQASSLYHGLLTSALQAYAEGMKSSGYPLPDYPVNQVAIMAVVNGMLGTVPVDSVFENVAIPLTEVAVKKAVLTKVGSLTSYLSSSFANAFHVDESALIGAFRLNFSEDELTRVVTQMFTKKKSTLENNLALLGYQDLTNPSYVYFYFRDFDSKTRFVDFLDNYNRLAEENHHENQIIRYTDATGILMSSVKVIVDAVSYVLIAFVSISLVVSSIMIGVITYISVYERTKEIGILRSIGASKHNISSIFNAETFIIGLLSGVFGIVVSYLFIPIINFILHQFIGDIPLYASLSPLTAATLIVISVILTLISGIIPARKASKRDPVEALRSE